MDTWDVQDCGPPSFAYEWGELTPCCGCEIVPVPRVKAWTCECPCHVSAMAFDRLLSTATHPPVPVALGGQAEDEAPF